MMEHELFRHVEIELYVPKAALPETLIILKQLLLHAADVSPLLDSDDPSNGMDSRFASDLIHIRGSYCHHYPICVREILADVTLISMTSSSGHCNETDDGRKTNIASEESACWYSITLTNYQKRKDRESFKMIASFLARNMAMRYSARPHWGKLCPLKATRLNKLYPAFERFRKVCIQQDPNHIFSNRWTSPQFTGREGRYVPLKETVRGFGEILDGKHDDLPEQAFYMVGTIDEAVHNAASMMG